MMNQRTMASMFDNPAAHRVDPLEETQENLELPLLFRARRSRWRWQFTLLAAIALVGLVVTGFTAVAAGPV